MQHRPSSGANLTLLCSNSACGAAFAAPAQQCLRCGALLRGVVLQHRFRIDTLLGHGGMGAVYRATDLTLDRLVALKVLAPSAGTAGDAPADLRARFFREARLAAQLDHPNIVPVLHFDIDGPLAYLVMPWFSGGTLAQRLRPGQPTDPMLVAGWLQQIAAALDFAHQHKEPIIHRDVKPSNLLFHADGRLCLADFGIARLAAGASSGEAAHLTRTGLVLGSLAYLAPEQFTGHAVPASDQYSTGVLLYEALTGALPFAAVEPAGLLLQHASATPPLPSERVPTLPGEVDAVVLRALSKQPEARFPTVGVLVEAFETALSSAPTAQRPRASTLPGAPRPTLPGAPYQGSQTSFTEDPRGDQPTKAATRWRLAAAWPAAGERPPHQTRTSRTTWISLGAVLLAGLLVSLLVLASLGPWRPPATTHLQSTARATSPTATVAQSDPMQVLRAAEQQPPLLEDALVQHDHQPGWDVPHPAHFDDHGLHLPPQSSGDNQNGGGTPYTTAQLPQPLPAHCAIEVKVRFSGPDARYGFSLLDDSSSGEDLLLTSTGSASVLLATADQGTPMPLANGTNAGLVLTHDQSYHLAVLLQGGQVAFFLNQQWINTLTYTPPFAGAQVLGLVNFASRDQPGGEVIFSALTIYPVP